MKAKLKTIAKLFLGLLISMSLFSCNKNVAINNVPISVEEKFGAVNIEKSIDEFNKYGFAYGDSVDVEFSNGYKLENIPYYNGYYGKVGDPIVISYPGNEYVRVALVNGDSMWEVSKVKKGDTANVKRKKKGKYLDTQKLLDLKYTVNREDYASDEVFANFRQVKVGNIKEGILYRGASPINNRYNRAKYADDLIKSVGIKYDVDLSDDDEDIKDDMSKDDFSSDYFKSLYDRGKVSLLSMNMNYKSEEFAKKIVKALTDMSKNDGPYYIHCVEGKDRTGFTLVVIEGLLNASYEEIIDDYMKTFDNYYGITEETNKERYEAIKNNYVDDMLKFLATRISPSGNENADLSNLEWNTIVGRYLIDNGMSEEDLHNLYTKLQAN